MDSILISETAAFHFLEKLESQNDYSKIIVLTDLHVKRHCYPLIKGLLPKHDLITIKPGERLKNITTCIHIWNTLTDLQCDRSALLLNLGGGVVCDMGAFVASTYKRGIDFINIPTTLLAMVDAALGGKTGIDFAGFKNQIGLFKNPKTILIRTQFLDTLPVRELYSGYAEIIKHCLIADRRAWNKLPDTFPDRQKLRSLILHSQKIKYKIVQSDPFEKHVRKSLNFGHTIGHAIESYFLHKKNKLLHGEAIAVGMICESFIAFHRKFIPFKEMQEIENKLLRIFKKRIISRKDITQIVQLAKQDKKNKSGNIGVCLLSKIGKPLPNESTTLSEIGLSLEYYNNCKV